jgi:hypothetical protein
VIEGGDVIHHAADAGRLKKRLIAQLRRAEHILTEGGKRIIATARRRRDERVLVAIVHFRGDDVAHGFTQHVFFARPTNLVADGQASDIFGDMMIEEGHSQQNAPSPCGRQGKSEWCSRVWFGSIDKAID